MAMLFDPEPRFRGLPEAGFDLFALPDRGERRHRIIETIHPALHHLGEDLIDVLKPLTDHALHAHLPRLDWPRDYEPFCTWLAISHEPHGYQGGPQLNVGVHADHVAARLGWDTSATAFGRFEFRCRVGHRDGPLVEVARENDLAFRVYAAAPWPQGSRLVFESPDDLAASFVEVHRRGVWWELGRRWEFPADRATVTAPELGRQIAGIFRALLPLL